MSVHDEFMLHAVALAKNGAMTVHPNPVVGCVIVRGEWIVGEGWHQRAGQAHAEVNAMEQARRKGVDLVDTTVYVTLEPCAHQGRTGPCSQALVEAGVSKVVVAMLDPNPNVQGKGIKFLCDHGVEVIVGVQEQAARELNPAFLKRMQTGMPFVQLKMAASLDGRTAMANGESQWITCEAAREDVQRYRARAGAIITGSGTFYQDKPSLTVRPESWKYAQYPGVVRQPLRVVVASEHPQGELESQPIFNDGYSTVWAGSEASAYTQFPLHIRPLDLPANGNGQDLSTLLRLLVREFDINSVWVEAGSILAASFIQEQLVDEFVLYYAASLMGSSAKPMFELPFSQMSEKQDLSIKSVRKIGETVRICAHLV